MCIIIIKSIWANIINIFSLKKNLKLFLMFPKNAIISNLFFSDFADAVYIQLSYTQPLITQRVCKPHT